MRRVAVLALLTTFSLAACATSNPEYDARLGPGLTLKYADSGRTIDRKVGEGFEIDLDANASTGYSWNMTTKPSPAILTAVQERYSQEPISPPVPGRGGTQVYSFKAVGVGTTSLRADYFRSFEKGAPPVRSFALTIRVSA